MRLEHLWALFAQAVTWFALDKPIDEISRLVRPSLWDFIRVDLDLLGQDVISDLFSVLTMVGTLAKHALICNNTHGKVVDSNSMILSAHDFWGHIARCPGCILRVLWVPKTSNTKISYSQIAPLVKDEILWLDVSMKNCIFV